MAGAGSHCMAAAATSLPLSGLSPLCRPISTRTPANWGRSASTELFVSTRGKSFKDSRRFEKIKQEDESRFGLIRETKPEVEEDEDDRKRKLRDYFEECRDLIRSDGGPPRWFSPLECGSHSPDSPLLLFLPGIDGTGLGLIMHHHRLGKIFDIWCLHIPVKDRTSFTGLLKLVERTVRCHNYRVPNRPVYLVGESLGGCLALAVAACNPDIDLVLILSNPGTSFANSPLQNLVPFLEIMPDNFPLNFPYMLSLLTGDPLRMLINNVMQGVPLHETVEKLSQDLFAMPSYLPVLADMLPRETLKWKLEMLKSASRNVNSCIHDVKAETLILCSGRDQLFPSQDESERLRNALTDGCQIRTFDNCGHFLFLENDIDLVTTIKGARFYRRGNYPDFVSDYIPPTTSEFRKIYESYRWAFGITSPVMLSTLEDGEVVKGLAGIPSEGPVLYVGYHMLLGVEIFPLVGQFMAERNILLRGLAHPVLFISKKSSRMPDMATFDVHKIMGAVPVSGKNLYRLLASKYHVLLYPGGMREAVHKKDEQYKLFWPEKTEFVRMAANFGAKIIPFGVIGEDDFGEVFFDYDDQMKIPYMKAEIEKMTQEEVKVRTNIDGEVAKQAMHLPWIYPKFPGRFYYYFAKPIETIGRKHELQDREKSQELYLHVKTEVERCIAYLKEKREKDPYRNLLLRLAYQASHGFTSEVPTFDL